MALYIILVSALDKAVSILVQYNSDLFESNIEGSCRYIVHIYIIHPVKLRALRVLDTRLVLEIFCPTRTRLGPNTTRTE